MTKATVRIIVTKWNPLQKETNPDRMYDHTATVVHPAVRAETTDYGHLSTPSRIPRATDNHVDHLFISTIKGRTLYIHQVANLQPFCA